MTITIDVPPDLAARLSAEAAHRGEDVPEVVRNLVERQFAVQAIHSYDPAAAIAALDSFDEGDEEEQRETLNTLIEALDRDRPGQRRIFGKGINPVPPSDEVA
jgi:hypothetical protein